MGLVADFGLGSIAIDTVVFIYFIEENPRFLPLIAPLFREADQDKRELGNVCTDVAGSARCAVPCWESTFGRTL